MKNTTRKIAGSLVGVSVAMATPLMAQDAATAVTAELTTISGASVGVATAGLAIWGVFYAFARLRRGAAKSAG